MIEVSIIIVNYNTYALTCACLESIYRHTTGVSFEVILVDNASTECPAEAFTQRFPSVILLKSQSNEGFAKGNNRGLAAAQGGTLLLLNSDTELIDNAIGHAHQLLRHKQREGVAVVTGKLVYPSGEVQPQCGRFPSLSLQLAELFRLQKLLSKHARGRWLLGGFFDHLSPVYPDWIWGTFFCFSSDLLKIFPGRKLPETYFMYQEDLEWCYQLHKHGRKIYYDPRIVVIHHFSGSATNQQLNEQKNKLLRDNLHHFMVRTYGRVYTFLFECLGALNKAIQF
ncbi:MAG: glycosyltransferase family 2 protein [Cyclobacteriaceae bacterium]|jgi:hypothetical protein|nr:glycosyltransferase family 2 protein [Cyclobacteriaceae bacterium]